MHNNYPLVSVCIPVFNGENFILEAVQSVLMQKYDNFELIVIDNCSTDSTSSILQKINDSRVKLIKNERNIGALKNFAKCVDVAQGEYFVLLPHDDYLLPGFIEKYVNKLENDNVGMVYSAVRIVKADRSIILDRITYSTNKRFTSSEAIEELFVKFNPIQLTMVRTSIVRKVGNFDPTFNLFIDVHLWLKVMLDGWGVYYYSTPCSCHRSHESQGQNAFLNLNLDILSDHWGKKLQRDFWKSNSYNYSFLKLMKFALNKIDGIGVKKRTISECLLKIFVRSHLRFMFLSLYRMNLSLFFQEVSLFKVLFTLYPISSAIATYPIVIFVEIKQRLFRVS